MKKMIFAGCLMVGASVFAQAGETDSLKVVNLQEVQIVSTRATSKTLILPIYTHVYRYIKLSLFCSV